MTTKLIIVRHGEAEGNIRRIFHGWTDSELTQKGHEQAKLLAMSLKDKPIDVLYSSSLKRTMQTAQYIANVKNLPIITNDKLWEINGGDWEGRYFADIKETWPKQYDIWENHLYAHAMPNGENVEEFLERLKGEIEYIVEINKDKNICIVTHGTAIRVLLCYFKGCPLEEIVNIPWGENTSVTVLDYSKDRCNFETVCDSSHLDSSTGTLINQNWYKEHMQKLKGDFIDE